MTGEQNNNTNERTGIIDNADVTAYVDILRDENHKFVGAYASGRGQMTDAIIVIRNEEEGRTVYYNPTFGGETRAIQGIMHYDNGDRFNIYSDDPHNMIRDESPYADPEYQDGLLQAQYDFRDDMRLLQDNYPVIIPDEQGSYQPASPNELKELAEQAIEEENRIQQEYIEKLRAERGEPQSEVQTQEPTTAPTPLSHQPFSP